MKAEENKMLDKIKEIICNCVAAEPDSITKNSKFLADLGLSSLDIVMMSVEVEREFGVKIPDKDFTKFKTVGDLMGYIEKA